MKIVKTISKKTPVVVYKDKLYYWNGLEMTKEQFNKLRSREIIKLRS